MLRLFAAIAIPDEAAEALMALETAIPGARWQERDNLHLTLRFIGEVDGRMAADIDDALAAIRAPSFDLELFGTGTFGNRDPRQLWAGVRPNPALRHLQRKVDTALQRLGLPSDSKKFVPHVTLARLKAPPQEKLIAFLSEYALFSHPAFTVDCFHLYSSVLSDEGSHYEAERDYPLVSAQNN